MLPFLLRALRVWSCRWLRQSRPHKGSLGGSLSLGQFAAFEKLLFFLPFLLGSLVTRAFEALQKFLYGSVQSLSRHGEVIANRRVK